MAVRPAYCVMFEAGGAMGPPVVAAAALAARARRVVVNFMVSSGP